MAGCPFCGSPGPSGPWAQAEAGAKCAGCGRDPTARRRPCGACGKMTPSAEPACCHCRARQSGGTARTVVTIILVIVILNAVGLVLKLAIR